MYTASGSFAALRMTARTGNGNSEGESKRKKQVLRFAKDDKVLGKGRFVVDAENRQ